MRENEELYVSDRAAQVTNDFMLGHTLLIKDASRCMYQLIFDALTPFISSYTVCHLQHPFTEAYNLEAGHLPSNLTFY
jgi:hypothetical protein